MRSSTSAALGLISALALTWACSSTKAVNPCAPTTGITGSGTLEIERTTAGTIVTDYTLSKAQAEDLFQVGSLTVVAGDVDAGVGALDPHDPVVLVHMDPSADDPGTYDLDTLHAQIAYCASMDAKLVVAGGAVTGCSPTGKPVTVALHGSLMVTSASVKSIAPATPGATGDRISLTAQLGSQSQACN